MADTTHITGKDYMYDEEGNPKEQYKKSTLESIAKPQAVDHSHWLFNPFDAAPSEEDKEDAKRVQLSKDRKKAVLNSISGSWGKSKTTTKSDFDNKMPVNK